MSKFGFGGGGTVDSNASDYDLGSGKIRTQDDGKTLCVKHLQMYYKYLMVVNLVI